MSNKPGNEYYYCLNCEAWMKGHWITVRDVPEYVCDGCDETFEVGKMLEEMDTAPAEAEEDDEPVDETSNDIDRCAYCGSTYLSGYCWRSPDGNHH